MPYSASAWADRSARRVGVLDIGSNSVRLVVFTGDRRAPFPIFNERALCGLGADLRETGRLSETGRASAIDNIARFVEIAREMRLERLEALATAAVREAANGPAFAADLERRFGLPVRVLTGDEEARLSALGVASAFPGADGVVGDLGGGSLELVDLAGGTPARFATLPLGPLRLGEPAGRGRKPLRRRVDAHLESLDWLDRLAGRPLYAVGGSWRGLARAHMADRGYPLRIIHGYTIGAGDAIDFLKGVSRRAEGLGPAFEGSRRRAGTLAMSALALWRLLRLGGAESVVFSAFGLREGCLYDRLAEEERRRDPLLSGFPDVVRPFGRFPLDEGELERWIAAFLAEPPPERLLTAICMLADTAWAEHPGYRGEHAFHKVLRLPLVGIGHEDRVFAALAILARYNGRIDHSAAAEVSALIPEARRARALAIGRALRFGFAFCGGVARLLRRTEVSRAGGRVTVRHPPDMAAALGDTVARRVAELSEALGAEVALEPSAGDPAARVTA